MAPIYSPSSIWSLTPSLSGNWPLDLWPFQYLDLDLPSYSPTNFASSSPGSHTEWRTLLHKKILGNQTIRWSSVIRFKASPDKPSLFFSLYSLFYSPFFFPSSPFLLLFSLTNKQLSASYFSPLQLYPDLVFPVLLVKVISALHDVTDGVIGGIADLSGLLSRRSLMLLFSCL